ncbi:hypothetical protein PR048_011619 [Dryococelus australis]|uniref:Uncharacterized protein n=1 Tax=Dryococelus australis TaxID=614101 RepID=A0ABQ9HM59_9NEOP|nr:hypothetical protein PR048_011619 [Dryococelus australis]
MHGPLDALARLFALCLELSTSKPKALVLAVSYFHWATSTGMNGWGKQEIPEKTHQPMALSCTISTCENPMTHLGIEPGHESYNAGVGKWGKVVTRTDGRRGCHMMLEVMTHHVSSSNKRRATIVLYHAALAAQSASKGGWSVSHRENGLGGGGEVEGKMQHNKQRHERCKKHALQNMVAEQFACSPPNKGNQVPSLAGFPGFRMWKSCRMMPLVGWFSCRSPVSPTLLFQCPSIHQSPSSALKTLLRLEAETDLNVDRCGIFVDLERGYLGASPELGSGGTWLAGGHHVVKVMGRGGVVECELRRQSRSLQQALAKQKSHQEDIRRGGPSNDRRCTKVKPTIQSTLLANSMLRFRWFRLPYNVQRQRSHPPPLKTTHSIEPNTHSEILRLISNHKTDRQDTCLLKRLQRFTFVNCVTSPLQFKSPAIPGRQDTFPILLLNSLAPLAEALTVSKMHRLARSRHHLTALAVSAAEIRIQTPMCDITRPTPKRAELASTLPFGAPLSWIWPQQPEIDVTHGFLDPYLSSAGALREGDDISCPHVLEGALDVTHVEQRSYIIIAVLHGRTAKECHRELVEAVGNNALPYWTVASSSCLSLTELLSEATPRDFCDLDDEGPSGEHSVIPSPTAAASAAEKILERALEANCGWSMMIPRGMSEQYCNLSTLKIVHGQRTYIPVPSGLATFQAPEQEECVGKVAGACSNQLPHSQFSRQSTEVKLKTTQSGLRPVRRRKGFKCSIRPLGGRFATGWRGVKPQSEAEGSGCSSRELDPPHCIRVANIQDASDPKWMKLSEV